MRSVWSRVATGSITVVAPGGVEAGQQDGRLHLGRGDGQPVYDRHRVARRRVRVEGQAAALAR